MYPPIVVLGYNRPQSLRRVLRSLEASLYGKAEGQVSLYISIDRSGDIETMEAAEEFEWTHGQKKIIMRSARMGMREHSLSCGDLAIEHGSIIFIEDDSFVSPSFYYYSCEALRFTENQENIAGVSLYGFNYNEFTDQTFYPIDDGYDNYYIGSATTWGVAWSRDQWLGIRQWFAERGNDEISSDDPMPAVISTWPKTSWKKHINRYLAMTGRYFFYPRTSLLTNFADPGSHFSGENFNFQVPLRLCGREYKFSKLSQSRAVYDGYFELEVDIYRNMCPGLNDIDFLPNIYNLRQNKFTANKLQLTMGHSSDAIVTYGCLLNPPEQNVLLGIGGQGLCVARTESIRRTKLEELEFFLARNKNFGVSRYVWLIKNILRKRFLGWIKNKK